MITVQTLFRALFLLDSALRLAVLAQVLAMLTIIFKPVYGVLYIYNLITIVTYM